MHALVGCSVFKCPKNLAAKSGSAKADSGQRETGPLMVARGVLRKLRSEGATKKVASHEGRIEAATSFRAERQYCGLICHQSRAVANVEQDNGHDCGPKMMGRTSMLRR